MNALLRFSMCSDNNKAYIKKTCSYIITIKPPTQCFMVFVITITQNEQIEAAQARTELGCGERLWNPSLEVFITPQAKALSDVAWIQLQPCFELEIELRLSWGPLQPQRCCDTPSVSCSLRLCPTLHSLPLHMLVVRINPVLPQPVHIPLCQLCLLHNCVE